MEEIVYTINRPLFEYNYSRNRYNEVVWLIGDGRSGTTWLSTLLKYNNRYREMFEPFHPIPGNGVRVKAHQYIRPGDRLNPLYPMASNVFDGKYSHHRVDFGNLRIRYDGLLIKDIFANLFARWAKEHFPSVRIVLLIRNPFSVALSKQKKPTWYWATDPKIFLDQDELVSDYLQPYYDLIAGCGDDYIERQLLIWSIIHHIPLQQFERGQICPVFYEDLYCSPSTEMARVTGYIRNTDTAVRLQLPDKLIRRPSRVSGKESTLRSGRSPIDSWKQELTARQIDRGYEIMDRFNLADLYGEDGMPNHGVVDAFLSRKAATTA